MSELPQIPSADDGLQDDDSMEPLFEFGGCSVDEAGTEAFARRKEGQARSELSSGTHKTACHLSKDVRLKFSCFRGSVIK